jgi:hypothetical protein
MNVEAYFESIAAQVGAFLPGILGALAILVIGWLIAIVLSRLIAGIVRKSGLEARVSGRNSNINLYQIVKKFVFYFLMVMVLLVVLETLGIDNVLEPLRDMLNKFLGFLPNIIAALIIGFVGYILATIISELAAAGSGFLERFADRIQFGASFDITRLVKQVVFLIIFIPILITAIDALEMKAISEPATDMLRRMLDAIPNIIAAVIILAVFYFVGRYVTQILKQLLINLEVDKLSHRMGMSAFLGTTSLASVLANVAFFFIIFFGIVTAVEKLGFVQLSVLLTSMLDMAGDIFFGLVILLVGNFIANVAHRALLSSDKFLADIAKVAILGLFFAISLSAMGVAEEIINLAFGLILGAIAVAVALSFGLGGREAAGRQMEHILKRFRNSNPPSPTSPSPTTPPTIPPTTPTPPRKEY